MTRFAGYAAIFDHPDRGGDIVRKGAFKHIVEHSGCECFNAVGCNIGIEAGHTQVGIICSIEPEAY